MALAVVEAEKQFNDFKSSCRHSSPKNPRRGSEKVLRVVAGEVGKFQVHSRDARVAGQGSEKRSRTARWTKSHHEHLTRRAFELEDGIRLRLAGTLSSEKASVELIRLKILSHAN